MKRTNILALSVFALALGACGSAPEASTVTAPTAAHVTGQNRIVGGTAFSEIPGTGALLLNGQMHCSATLITKRTIVTAGHCVFGYAASAMTFVIGPNIKKPSYTLKVKSITAHPQYDEQNISNDIGLVELEKDAPVEPLPVLASLDDTFVGSSLLFVGYGVTNGYTQTGDGEKRAVSIKLSKVNAQTFRYDDPRLNTCNGDSGGPAFYKDEAGKYFIVGVTSYGDAYCTKYGVDTRVDIYKTFLGLDGSAAPSTSPASPSTPPTTTVPAPATDACQGETFAGRCDGSKVIWCENAKVYESNCADKGQACMFDDVNSYYGCGRAQKADPCSGETFEGRCADNQVIWCENGNVFALDCTAKSMVCGLDSTNAYFNCQ